MNCINARDYLLDYIDNELPYSIRQEMEEHLSECLPCKAELDSFKKAISLLQLRSVPEPEAVYWDSTWESIVPELAAPATRIGLPRLIQKTRFHLPERLFKPAFAVAAAVLILGLVGTYWYHGNAKSDKIANYETEYNLIFDDATGQGMLVGRTVPSELQPDIAYMAYSRAALGGIDPISKSAALMEMEEASK